MKTFQCPLSLLLSDVLSLSVFLSISSNGTIFLGVLQSFFFLFYVSFHLNPLLSTQAILRHINFSHFYLIIFSFCLPTHIFTFFPHSLQWFLCPGLLHHLSSFHSLSHYHNHALSDVSLAPHLSLTCGNLCSLHRPTALLDENVGNISLLSMHANRLWVFLAL